MKQQENLYTPDCIRTYTGLYVNVFDPTPDMFRIEDIAHALSMQPRFGGHLPRFYSVAQHCCQCAYMTKEEEAFNALMHDASEAYLIDIPSPIKKRLANYKEIEDGLMKVLSQVFGFTYPITEGIKDIDKLVLEMEWCDIMLTPNNLKPDCWSQQMAEYKFLLRYNQFKP